MGTFEELADRLIAALDEAAEGIREGLRSQGRPQKYLVNRVRDASATLVSRWLSGARQLAERNRLPGAEVMREIATGLELPADQTRRLVALGATIDDLRRQLEGEERGWRAGAAERLAREASGDGGGESEAAGRPSRRSVPLLTAVLATTGLVLVSFVAGTFAGRSWSSSTAAGPSIEPSTGPEEHPPADGEQCSPWTDAGQGVLLRACIRIRESRMLIRNQLRGPVGTRSDLVIRAYDSFQERPVTRELKCHKMFITVEDQTQTCGWYEVRPPYGSKYAAQAGWRLPGTGVFAGFVVSPSVTW
ncbi:hypothetical protein [Nonomuraea cavernae]|uniref:Uncharacterized protein n=1 Tax=Nonomuraea cavernae TaxID=2045107 RepID=A0A917Z882_9ACTN|nr:hypothetical protein [Nonomuraea cavernae]MCA2189892.1 hypothetical protein [Nonomuraea cavernae]GGO77807.1 hypothetical protein GCM10012289_58330 [Nonomuraea cavernae]